MTEPMIVDRDPPRLIPMAIYICYLGGFVAGISAIVGVVLAYVNRGSGPDWLESHYRYQIRTFWILLVYLTLGFVLTLLLIGWLVLLAVAVWLILRCARGLTWLDRRQPVPDPETWMV